jgi:hypothetical protein
VVPSLFESELEHPVREKAIIGNNRSTFFIVINITPKPLCGK